MEEDSQLHGWSQDSAAALQLGTLDCRARYEEGADAFVAAVLGFVRAKGISFIRYDEAKKVHDSHLNAKAIGESHEWLSMLRALQENLAFPRSVVNDAMKFLTAELAASWNLKPEHQADYPETMTRCIMNMNRHVQQ